MSYGSSDNYNYSIAETLCLAKGRIWEMTSYSDWLLMTLLEFLITKTTNLPSKFGFTINTKSYGSLNNKGLFYGSNGSGSPNKMFGMESVCGNHNEFCSGLILTTEKTKLKYTYSAKDGTSVIGYNQTGEGYLEVENSFFKTGGSIFVKNFQFGNSYMLPLIGGGSGSTYYCAYVEVKSSSYPRFMGWGSNYACSNQYGSLTSGYSSYSATSNYTPMSARLVCRPLA